MIGEYVKRNYEAVDLNKDGEISYVMFMGEKGNNEAIFRTRYGVEDADRVLTEANLKPLKFYDPSNTDKYLVDKDGKWSASAANEYMTTALASYNEANNNMIELVICNNDGMAEGAISALNTVGYNTGGEKMIPVSTTNNITFIIKIWNQYKFFYNFTLTIMRIKFINILPRRIIKI